MRDGVGKLRQAFAHASAGSLLPRSFGTHAAGIGARSPRTPGHKARRVSAKRSQYRRSLRYQLRAIEPSDLTTGATPLLTRLRAARAAQERAFDVTQLSGLGPMPTHHASSQILRDLVNRPPITEALYGRAFRVMDSLDALRRSQERAFARPIPRGINEKFGVGQLNSEIRAGLPTTPSILETTRAIVDPYSTHRLMDEARARAALQPASYVGLSAIAASTFTRDIPWIRAGRAHEVMRDRPHPGMGALATQFGLGTLSRSQPQLASSLGIGVAHGPLGMPGSIGKLYAGSLPDASASVKAIIESYDMPARVQAMINPYDVSDALRAAMRAFEPVRPGLADQLLRGLPVDPLPAARRRGPDPTTAPDDAAGLRAWATEVGAALWMGARSLPVLLDLRLISLWPKLDSEEQEDLRTRAIAVTLALYQLGKSVLEDQSLATVLPFIIAAHISMKSFRSAVSGFERRHN